MTENQDWKESAENSQDQSAEPSSELMIPDLTEKVMAETGIDSTVAERAVQTVLRETIYSAPIPHPEQIRAYNDIEDRLGTRILEDHLAQRQHERDCDKEVLRLGTRDADRKDKWQKYARTGLYFGFVSQGVFVAAALYAMHEQQTALALALVATPALGVVGKFIKGAFGSNKPTTPEDQDED